MPGARRGNAGFDRRRWLFARSHALEEVLHVVDGSIAKTVCFDDGILSARYAFMEDAKATPVELQRPLRPAKLQAPFVDHTESGIAHRGLHRVRTIPLLKHVFVG
jgi:hypothetical protein